MCASGRPHNVMDRDRGEYVRADEEVDEPARTERLLQNPWLLLRTTATDMLDTHRLVFMNRASGPALTGLLYDYALFAVQLVIGVLYGLGPALTAGSSWARAQAVAVLCCQCGAGMYVLGLGLSADRIENTVTGWQHVAEGLSTAVLAAEGSASLAFRLALLAMFLPLIQKFCACAELDSTSCAPCGDGYQLTDRRSSHARADDAIIVQISLICRNPDEFSWQSAMFALLALLLAIPSAVIALSSVKCDNLSNMADSADLLNSAVEEGVEDLVANEQVLAALSAIASDMFWMTRSKRHVRAASLVQKKVRWLQSERKGGRASAAQVPSKTGRAAATPTAMSSETSLRHSLPHDISPETIRHSLPHDISSASIRLSLKHDISSDFPTSGMSHPALTAIPSSQSFHEAPPPPPDDESHDAPPLPADEEIEPESNPARAKVPPVKSCVATPATADAQACSSTESQPVQAKRGGFVRRSVQVMESSVGRPPFRKRKSEGKEWRGAKPADALAPSCSSDAD
jgi:hypothetical protein